jgi:hypothetical protein
MRTRSGLDDAQEMRLVKQALLQRIATYTRFATGYGGGHL